MKNESNSLSSCDLSNVTGSLGGWTGMIADGLGLGGDKSGGSTLGNAWSSVKGAIGKPFADIANIGAGGRLF